MIKVLWIAPNLNHYKSRFLNRLSQCDLEITVLAGAKLTAQGHRNDTVQAHYRIANVPVGKGYFAFHPMLYKTLAGLLYRHKFDVVLMPLEKKHIPIIFFLYLSKYVSGYQFATYNHPTVKFRKRFSPLLEKYISKYLFCLYDKVVFYTEQSRRWAVTERLVSAEKSFFANNTLDTDTIWANHSFTVNRSVPITLLFIGRLIVSKRPDMLVDYYTALKAAEPSLRLIVIGDGPEVHHVRSLAANDPDVVWPGAVVDEQSIKVYMEQAHAVFVPGASGLSIVHAFCYGKPYMTVDDNVSHGPEISYLEDGKNGLKLSGIVSIDIATITTLLNDHERYRSMCRAAYDTAMTLSIDKWCTQMRSALSA